MMRRFALLCAAALLLLSTAVSAQMPKDYPNRPIHVVVPSPPGGPPDLLIRLLLPKLSAALGQPLIVENRAGAGGLVGTAYVATQP